MVKALCTSELIADFFVLGDGVTQHVSIYPYVLIFCILDDLEYRQLF